MGKGCWDGQQPYRRVHVGVCTPPKGVCAVKQSVHPGAGSGSAHVLCGSEEDAFLSLSCPFVRYPEASSRMNATVPFCFSCSALFPTHLINLFGDTFQSLSFVPFDTFLYVKVFKSYQ